jgi:hypothetical protein
MKRIVQDINDTLDVEGLCRALPKRVQAVIVQDINDTLDVEGLCRAFPKRVQAVVDAQGDRIGA